MMLTTDLQRGGLPLRLARLAPRLRSIGVEAVVGCLAEPGPLSDELDQAGIATFSCDAGGPSDATCLVRLARIVRRIDPDLIHASLFHANLAARIAGKLDRPRPIITSTVTIEIERAWHRWGEAATNSWSDLHVANSQAVADHLYTDLGFDSGRVVVIPNGLDVAAIVTAHPARRSSLGIQENIPLVVWAGRMDPVKNLETFVEVIACLRARRAVAAVMLGDGPDRPRIERLISERGLEGAMFLTRWSDDVIGWLKAADLLVFPSLTEGSPNVVLEAMAAGCPIVAADVPAIRELIEPDVSGLLRQPRDGEGLAQAAATLLDNRQLSNNLAASARRRVAARHDINGVVGLWGEVYRRAMGRP